MRVALCHASMHPCARICKPCLCSWVRPSCRRLRPQWFILLRSQVWLAGWSWLEIPGWSMVGWLAWLPNAYWPATMIFQHPPTMPLNSNHANSILDIQMTGPWPCTPPSCHCAAAWRGVLSMPPGHVMVEGHDGFTCSFSSCIMMYFLSCRTVLLTDCATMCLRLPYYSKPPSYHGCTMYCMYCVPGCHI